MGAGKPSQWLPMYTLLYVLVTIDAQSSNNNLKFDSDQDGTVTVEEGSTKVRYVSLKQIPQSDVTFTFPTIAEVTFTPSSFTFTTANWNAGQVVTMKGVEDSDIGGNRSIVASLTVVGTDTFDSFTITHIDNDFEYMQVFPEFAYSAGEKITVTFPVQNTLGYMEDGNRYYPSFKCEFYPDAFQLETPIPAYITEATRQGAYLLTCPTPTCQALAAGSSLDLTEAQCEHTQLKIQVHAYQPKILTTNVMTTTNNKRFAFWRLPTITSVLPAIGRVHASEWITITGTNFIPWPLPNSSALECWIGGKKAENVTHEDKTTIRCLAPVFHELEGSPTNVTVPLLIKINGLTASASYDWKIFDSLNEEYTNAWLWLGITLNIFFFIFILQILRNWLCKNWRITSICCKRVRLEEAVHRGIKGPTLLMKRLEDEMREEDEEGSNPYPIDLEKWGIHDKHALEKKRIEQMKQERMNAKLEAEAAKNAAKVEKTKARKSGRKANQSGSGKKKVEVVVEGEANKAPRRSKKSSKRADDATPKTPGSSTKKKRSKKRDGTRKSGKRSGGKSEKTKSGKRSSGKSEKTRSGKRSGGKSEKTKSGKKSKGSDKQKQAA